MKVIDVLNSIANGTIKEGFKFEFEDDIFTYKLGLILSDEGKKFSEMYFIERCLDDEVKILEDKKDKIEKLMIEDEGETNESLYKYIVEINNKINELVRAVNRLNKEEK